MVDQAAVIEKLRMLRAQDPELGEELQRRLRAATPEVAFVPRNGSDAAALTPETIVLRTGRPVLGIREDAVRLDVQFAESETWRARIAQASAVLNQPIRGVGRIELKGHPYLTWVGTGWLIRSDVMVTNRHVAREFAKRSGDGFTFRIGVGQPSMEVDVNFLAEFEREERRVLALREVLHIEEDDGPDFAFLRIAESDFAAPVKLSTRPSRLAQTVAVIGYPARDSRIPDAPLMDRLFGNVYDCKRFAPGQITFADDAALLHDCTTLGGNSGSLIVDLATGHALGLHFAGRFLKANYAVPAALLEEALHRVLSGKRSALSATKQGVEQWPGLPVQVQPAASPRQQIALTIPLHVTIDVGDLIARLDGGVHATSTPSATSSVSVVASLAAPSSPDTDIEVEPEGKPQDYVGRQGFLRNFLGDGIDVALPRVVRDADQVLSFSFDGNERETELRYLHFSVVMHATRRMCFFSAVNIDGNRYRRTIRPGWMLDPRIPKDRQILRECYGNPPKFSRGHMTRREDPAWGTAAEAERGNADSMHVTNVVPQMQSLNAGLWLGLEDYALKHARQDSMKICVISGPVLLASDPLRDGVRIPLTFWKVIAFVHDTTGELSVTGYSMAQKELVTGDEFVFGAFKTYQRSLAWIETQAGVSFGALTHADRFIETELPDTCVLTDWRQIRY
ncbi:DNA/RNA non-specific endonuclease [Burkholderia sp. Ac-20365]|uniref:DNA/RNA non-specific endonuclease n=1 Tax=Burkholderia sp. Ac-20365 TaxID=2703897 RepID=UPI00197B1CD8|nr:DNA/RNA non-specific endonuclease [Burkholderia sp. Ac-20365]MBN3760770.1 hypothetical protein [Burkholderia sp. Ac-20365]